jgi:hypothetical protein
MGGVSMAVLWSDRDKGPHGTFTKFELKNPDSWKVNLKGRTQAELTVDPDIAVALLDDSVKVARPRPVPLPGSLVVKKGSKIFGNTVLSMP